MSTDPADHMTEEHPVAQDPDTTPEPLPEMASLVTTTLRFTCGETEISLAELESFQVGALVALPETLTKDSVHITVSAGAQPIAEGELVQIEDRFAVRIIRLMAKTS